MTGRAALAITAASIAASALNYFYQVHAARVLDAAAFGLLSTWLARVTVIGAVATVVQFVSLDFAVPDRRFARLLQLVGTASLAAMALHVALADRLSHGLLAVLAVGAGIVLYAVLGQLQARLQLGIVAATGLVAALTRFALPFVWPRDAHGFYVAQSAATFAGIVVAAAIVTTRGPSTAAPAPTERRLRLARPLLLAFATVLFPLLDVLVISAMEDAATTGAFSRVQLASRIIFFAGAAALQILLPHELHAAKEDRALPRFAMHLQRWLAPGIVGAALVLAILLDGFVLHPHGDERVWLYASCLAAALLVAVLGHVNRLAALDRLGVAAVCVAGVVATSAASAVLAMLATGSSVTRYVVGVLVGDALVLLVARAAQMRSRPGALLR